MKSGPILDPELRALLREITTDPRSRLMKLVTQGLDGRVRLHEPPISEGEPFLTRAERHLVREHREDVAVLLGMAAQRLLLDRPSQETLLYRSGLEVPNRDYLRHRRTGLAHREPADAKARDALGPSAEGWGLDARSAQGLASASLRLWPRDEIRIWIGLAHLVDGDRSAGTAALVDARWARLRPSLISMIEQALAFEEILQDRPAIALEGYVRAWRVDPTRPQPLLGWLQAALLSHDRSATLEVDHQMSELPGPALVESLGEHVELWRARGRAGAFRPSEGSISFVTRISEELGPHAREIATLFLGGSGA